MRLPIRTRLTAWYVAVLAVLLAALTAFVVVELRADLVADSDRRLDDASTQIARGYEVEGVEDFHDVAATVLPSGGGVAQVVESNGLTR